ncbi:MAG: hypothetical protein JOY51_02175 [Nevskia sp.]|nr:hypothetical protein [Nevskia sp.]
MAATHDHREEAAYAAVLAELRNGVRDEPLMAKAYAEANGDDNQARARYLRWRAAKLLQAAEREHRREWVPAAPPARRNRQRWMPRRSWSHARAYDLLLIAAVGVALFLFNGDVHRAVLHAVKGLGWR